MKFGGNAENIAADTIAAMRHQPERKELTMPDNQNEVKLAEIIDIPLREFFDMKAAPGHRDSEGRAHKVTHLTVLMPEHLEVEVAEYPNAMGILQRVRMTGNTRAQVWKCGLADRTPPSVRARLYRMQNEDEVRQRMLRHDSPEAAWSPADYRHRALDMTYGDSWRPRSKALSNFTSAVRHADSLVNHSRWSPDNKVKVELILPGWGPELKALDELCDHPLADTIREKKIFTWGFLGGLLILLRFQPSDRIEAFARAIFNDRGEKLDDGYDGVQALIENLGRKASTPDHQQKVLMCVMGAFDQWQSGVRSTAAVNRVRKFEPLDYIRRERERLHEEQRDGQRVSAAE